MTDDELKQLLQTADGGNAPPALSADDLLAAALQRRRHETRQKAVVSLALCGVVLGGLWSASQLSPEHFVHSRSSPLPLVGKSGEGGRSGYALQSPLNPPHHGEGTGVFGPAVATDSRPFVAPISNVDALRRDLDRLDREAELRRQVVQAVMEYAPPSADAAEPGPALSDVDLVRLEAARSAAVSWQYAQLVETEMHDADAALREYQRVAKRFPGTTWAELALHSAARLANANAPSL